MAAPKGNQFWKLAPKQGRRKIWEKPEDLKLACEEYFESIVKNPLFETKVIAFEGNGYDHPVDKMRVMTIEGLCVFLGIARSTWDNYKNNESYIEFLEVVEYVEAVMYDYKLSGAAAGLFNSSIISRELKLKDTTETQHSGSMSLSWEK